MSPDVVKIVIAPLLKVEYTVVVAISTPQGRANFFSMFQEASYKNGKKIFVCTTITTACLQCRGTDRERSCRHPTTDAPEWVDEDQEEVVAALIGSNDDAIYDREMRGIIADDENMAFPAEDLEKFCKSLPYKEPHKIVDQFFVAFDPNGGSTATTGSESALVSFFYDGPFVVIIGFETFATANNYQAIHMIKTHIRGVRSCSCFSGSIAVLVPEVNIPVGDVLAHELITFPNVKILSTRNKGYGVKTNKNNKYSYAIRFAKRLATESLVYHHTLIVTSPFDKSSTPRQKLQIVKTEFERQLHAFQQVVKESGNLRTEPYITVSGKVNSEYSTSTSKRDDICMSIILGIYFTERLLSGKDPRLELRGPSEQYLEADHYINGGVQKRKRVREIK